jgi:hypothetical protein
MNDQSLQKTWHPTRKWWVGIVTSLTALATNILHADHWSKDFNVAIVTIIAGALTSYLVPNSDNPGGYESKKAPPLRPPTSQPTTSVVAASNGFSTPTR